MFKPSSGTEMDVTIHSIHLLPKQLDQFIMCNKSNTIAIMNMQGQVSSCILYSVQLASGKKLWQIAAQNILAKRTLMDWLLCATNQLGYNFWQIGHEFQSFVLYNILSSTTLPIQMCMSSDCCIRVYCILAAKVIHRY